MTNTLVLLGIILVAGLLRAGLLYGLSRIGYSVERPYDGRW